MSADVVLRLKDLHVDFPTDDGLVRAVDGLSLEVRRHEVIGIVGESGSGKTMTALAVMGLLPPNANVRGSVTLSGFEVVGAREEDMRAVRGRVVSMAFQDSLAALNPVQPVGVQIAEAITVHRAPTARSDVSDRVVELLDLVGIANPRRRAREYPHEFSGGMRQRVMIAMAIANEPDVLIADEPTTALDVTIQAQVLDVLGRIQDRTGSAIVLITHDLGVVAGMAHRVLVMYAGRAAEIGSVDSVFNESMHPYTRGLLASVPGAGEDNEGPLRRIRGEPPSATHPPSGCAFHPRCEYARLPDPCATRAPGMVWIGSQGAACHFAEEVAAGSRPGDTT